jgi:uracil DNA glycosylase
VGPLRGTEELIHRLECHSLFARKLVANLQKVEDEEGLTFVSGTRNQTKMNMVKQKQEKAMKAPYPPSPMVVSMLGTARAMTRLKSH